MGETLQGLNGPEMLPLLAEQSEKEVTVFITNINIFILTTAIITSLCAPKASYAWKIAGFTTCTASCLGGLQESIVICVETEKENPVAPYFCDPHKRLEIEVLATILHRMIKLHPHNQILLSRYELATRTLVLLVGTSQTSGLPQKIFSKIAISKKLLCIHS